LVKPLIIMKYTFRDHFSAIAPGLSTALLAPVHAQAIGDLCSLFPFDAASDFGFESRLGNPEATCDFFLQIRKERAGSGIIAGKSEVARLSPVLLNNPFWQGISKLFEAWIEPSSILNKRLELFWLEFDCLESSFNPIPNIFFKINGNTESRKAQWGSMLEVLNEIYGILFRIKFPAGLGENLKRCTEALPQYANIYQVGFMIPRKTEAVRLILNGFRDDSIIEYLKNIRWPGEIDAIHKMIERYAVKFDHTAFNLHIGEMVLPFFGTEMYLSDMSQPIWDPRWREILDFLEAENLLLRGKREGLGSYSSKKKVSYLLPVNYISGINHLKIAYKPGMPLECKGYFGTMINPQKEAAIQHTVNET